MDKRRPFKLETLTDAHRLIAKDATMVTCDEKSGYDHVKLQLQSQTYFGVQFGGWIMSYTTLGVSVYLSNNWHACYFIHAKFRYVHFTIHR